MHSSHRNIKFSSLRYFANLFKISYVKLACEDSELSAAQEHLISSQTSLTLGYSFVAMTIYQISNHIFIIFWKNIKLFEKFEKVSSYQQICKQRKFANLSCDATIKLETSTASVGRLPAKSIFCQSARCNVTKSPFQISP